MLLVHKTFSFSAAHRVIGHQGLCQFLHGHTWHLTPYIRGRKNSLGMVIDFAELKDIVSIAFLDEWDHSVLLADQDPLVIDDAMKPRICRLPAVTVEGIAEYAHATLTRVFEAHWADLGDKAPVVLGVAVREGELAGAYFGDSNIGGLSLHSR